MDTSSLVCMLVVAAAGATLGRRWRVPYVQAAVRIVVRSLLPGHGRGASSWPRYGFAVHGLTWIGLDASEFWRQQASHRLEGS